MHSATGRLYGTLRDGEHTYCSERVRRELVQAKDGGAGGVQAGAPQLHWPLPSLLTTNSLARKPELVSRLGKAGGALQESLRGLQATVGV